MRRGSGSQGFSPVCKCLGCEGPLSKEGPAISPTKSSSVLSGNEDTRLPRHKTMDAT